MKTRMIVALIFLTMIIGIFAVVHFESGSDTHVSVATAKEKPRNAISEEALAIQGMASVTTTTTTLPPPPPTTEPPPPITEPPPAPAPAPTTQQVQAPPEPSTQSGACGGATNGADQYIQRESGGDPNVYNSGGSGAWGCYQLMPEHFAPGGTCSDMVYGQATPAQQAECASRLPLSAWGG